MCALNAELKGVIPQNDFPTKGDSSLRKCGKSSKYYRDTRGLYSEKDIKKMKMKANRKRTLSLEEEARAREIRRSKTLSNLAYEMRENEDKRWK